MNLVQLEQKLIAAARANPPSDRVPYAFEKRIMAQLASQPLPDTLAFWARALWRAAIPCVAAVALFAGLSLFVQETTTPVAGDTVVATTPNLSDELENTLLADLGQNTSDEEVW